MLQFLHQLRALIQSSLSWAAKCQVSSPAPQSDPSMPGLEKADTEGNEDDTETVLEEAV